MATGHWKRVSRIAADALEREGAARTQYLDRACGGDGALRAEVDRIVNAGVGFDTLLDGTGSRTSGLSVARATAVPGVAPALPASRRADRESSGGRLPAELIERSARRLGVLAQLYAAGFLLAYVIRELTVHGAGGSPYRQEAHTPGQVMVAVFVMLAVSLSALASRKSLAAPQMVNAGLVFEVIASLGIALASYSGTWEAEGAVWGVSWLCVWIVVFTMTIPAPPRAAAVAAFASAAMGPLAIVLWAGTRQFAFPPAHVLLAATAPNFVGAALAWFGSRHVYRIGLELSEAKRLGRYRLVAPLGRGGMGEVWIAEHDLLARPAALTLIRQDRAGAASPEAIARFEREAQSTAALSSPHTVRLYDFGLTEDGLFYYVMERLEGLDLESLVRRAGPLPPERAVHLLRQACDSLAEAHGLGLIHRDIKPSNLFACRQGLEHDFLKVLDFGIVKPQTEGSPAAENADGFLTIEGTPSFMAPEAAALGIANPRTDLYSLGCVGYWLLTGRPVVEGGPMAAVLWLQRGERPVPPSQLVGHPIPAELESAVLACLEKDPAGRPADMNAFAELLARVPGPAWDQEQARACWRWHETGEEASVAAADAVPGPER